MKNSSAFEKTALLLGLIIGEVLRKRTGLHGFLDSETPVWQRIVRGILFFALFSKARKLLSLALWMLPGYQVKYLTLVLQPVLMAFFLPLFAHLLNFGKFFGPVTEKRVKLE